MMGSLVLESASCEPTKSSLVSKGVTIETALQHCLLNLRELVLELNKVQAEYDTCKTELTAQKEKCERKTCSSSDYYNNVLKTKNTIIELAASAITRLNETKDLSFISEILKILCGEVTTTVTPPKKQEPCNARKLANILNDHANTPTKARVNKKLLTPKKELDNSIEDISFKDESISEIDGTPGRTSPIIHSKKLKSSSSSSFSGNSTDSREKKKCPDSWQSSESKQIKLSYMKSTGKSRQSKLFFTESKALNVVDLTCSPELSKGSGTVQNGDDVKNSPLKEKNAHPFVQILIKKESSDNDDTILPSPTSSGGPPTYLLSKTVSKENSKFKKPLSLSRVKAEVDEANSPILQVVDPKLKDFLKVDNMEESINILQPKRFQKSPHKASPRKQPSTGKLQIKKEADSMKMEHLTQLEPAIKLNRSPVKENLDRDLTHCEDASMIQKAIENSPTKRPLADNMNVTNLPPTQIVDNSMSLLRPEPLPSKPIEDNAKRMHIENVEPVYKEPTVRKKAEKMALPAWCCDECKTFFGDLYADDPEKIKAAIDRCSKHRGKNNPARPKTPPGFWNPRWDVPDNTEEFNRRNNVA